MNCECGSFSLGPSPACHYWIVHLVVINLGPSPATWIVSVVVISLGPSPVIMIEWMVIRLSPRPCHMDCECGVIPAILILGVVFISLGLSPAIWIVSVKVIIWVLGLSYGL